MPTPTDTATTYRFHLSILGTIWWPMGAECANDLKGSVTFTEPITDDAELADAILLGNDGDFSEIIDFSVEIETIAPCGHPSWRTIKPWASDDMEMRFVSCYSTEEDN